MNSRPPMLTSLGFLKGPPLVSDTGVSPCSVFAVHVVPSSLTEFSWGVLWRLLPVFTGLLHPSLRNANILPIVLTPENGSRGVGTFAQNLSGSGWLWPSWLYLKTALRSRRVPSWVAICSLVLRGVHESQLSPRSPVALVFQLL